MIRFFAIILICLFAGTHPVHAQTRAQEIMPDPALQARAVELYKDLRCISCQGQSLVDSEAEMALSLRALVRQQLRNGSTDKEIRDYITSRYGDSVLMKPPFKSSTFLLWGAPLIILLLACGIAMTIFRPRSNIAPEETA